MVTRGPAAMAAIPGLEATVVATLGLEGTAGDNLVVGVEIPATEAATLVRGATEVVTLDQEALGVEDLVVIQALEALGHVNPALEGMEEVIPVLEALGDVTLGQEGMEAVTPAMEVTLAQSQVS